MTHSCTWLPGYHAITRRPARFRAKEDDTLTVIHLLPPQASLQLYCNAEGLNQSPGTWGVQASARIGIIGNENTFDCSSPDSVIGFGLKFSTRFEYFGQPSSQLVDLVFDNATAGNVCGYGCDNGDVVNLVFGYILGAAASPSPPPSPGPAWLVGTDLAYGQPTVSSSVWYWGWNRPENAVNKQDPAAQCCPAQWCPPNPYSDREYTFRSSCNSPGGEQPGGDSDQMPWITVDLGRAVNVSTVQLWNRQGSLPYTTPGGITFDHLQDHLYAFAIYVGDAPPPPQGTATAAPFALNGPPCYSQLAGPPPNPYGNYPCGKVGRFVTVQQTQTYAQSMGVNWANCLHMCSLRVFVEEPPKPRRPHPPVVALRGYNRSYPTAGVGNPNLIQWLRAAAGRSTDFTLTLNVFPTSDVVSTGGTTLAALTPFSRPGLLLLLLPGMYSVLTDGFGLNEAWRAYSQEN